ncbi:MULTISPECIES: DUF1419 domain-containing protein [Xanthobacter]|jgi:hypothetical protein|uniref:DUF1419 domain-containing protein n=1 Tax=Xanthobacter autotrophicus (strain ATCC BAA-1158 / Py2) TaxID=78245 RepID=A7IQ75_XANP2|nr:protein of unknown function DUF1419 [Xanthobacter autotrophicus Py2]OYX90643.1 MAG: hypothetical protein B7Y84_00255 [Azorhizobium sp. 32-67-21]HML43921.1 DUF1419 domain-containing protein [Hyphomicrobium zavarzinii]
MTLSTPIRKVFQGVPDRRQMFRMFDRHAQRPFRWDGDASALYTGEWFETSPVDHDYMFEILPPLWMRGDMFAMREFLTGSVTGVFFALMIDGRVRHFHGYCDLADTASPERMRAAIINRESRPVKAMTRTERLEHIWSATHDDYRGYAGDRWPEADRGKRTVLFYGGRQGTSLVLLDGLTDAQVSAKLPVHLRYLPDAIAA